MVDLVEQYNPDAEATSFEQIPDGTYLAQIVESEKQPISKDKDLGDCLSLTWQVTAGEFENRLFWQRLNLWWSGPEKTPGQVTAIANSQFAAVREATGRKIVNDSEELHFIPCAVSLGRQKKDERYQEVKSVKPAGNAQAGRSAPARAPAGAQPANSGQASQRNPWPRRDAANSAANNAARADDIPF